ERDEPHQFLGLVAAGDVGVGIASDTALGLVGEEAQDAGGRFAPSGQVVVVEDFGFASKGDGMEIQAEFLGLGKQQRSQGGDSSGQQSLLAGPRGAVGIIGGIALLGQNIQAGEQAQ